MRDEVSLKDTRIDELLQQIEDKEFELRKSWAREERLDYRWVSFGVWWNFYSNPRASYFSLHCMAKERTEVPNVNSNAGGGGGSEDREVGFVDFTKFWKKNVQKFQLSDLQAECDLQKELAEQRLEEIKEMTGRIEALSSECEDLRLKVCFGVL